MIRLRLAMITRNRKGQPVRAERVLEAESFAIGRGTQCAIHLPDPRVAFEHATIFAAGRAFHIAAAGGPAAATPGGAMLPVDGRVARERELAPGAHCELGPYELTVEPPPPSADLAIAIELIRPLPDDLAEIRARSRISLAATALGKRTPAWSLLILIAIMFLALPVFNAVVPPLRALSAQWKLGLDTAWNPGPLAAGHQSFGHDCGACHQFAFRRVRAAACLACHEKMPGHVRSAQLERELFGATRCASCHADHNGAEALVRTDTGQCVGCHRDLKLRVPSTALREVGDFATAHPGFKVTLPRGPRERDVVRVAQDDGANLVERSNLAFPHDKHLKPNLRAPQGRVTLDCRRCHTEDESGRGFVAIDMNRHCLECHTLEFEPAVTTRQVPHGNVDDVLLTMQEFYANIALNDVPVDVIDLGDIRRSLPKLTPGTITEAQRRRALAWARAKAQAVGADLFEKRVCKVCHDVRRAVGPREEASGVSWSVAPVRIAETFLPKASFDHAKHRTYGCADCHAAERSARAHDVDVPDIENCRKCHAGEKPATNKVVSTCVACHGFHLPDPLPLRRAGVRGKPDVVPHPPVIRR